MKLRSISYWSWELPQTLLGWVLTKLYKAVYARDFYIVDSPKFGGISLGKYILIGHLMPSNCYTHEKGHQLQSLYLGPLYLLVVGIPSLLVGVFHKDETYFKHYPESWADALGKVKR